MPAGLNGKIVARLWLTCTSNALWTVAAMLKARRKKTTRHDHVEQRLQEHGGDQGRIGRSIDPPLGDEELHCIACARRDQRIDAGAGDVGAKQLPPADATVDVRGLDDVPPGARSDE